MSDDPMVTIDLLKAPNDKEFRVAFLSSHLRQSIASQIRALRLKHHLTQRQLADGIGTSQNSITRWEDPTSESSPQIGTLFRIAKFFDVGLIIRFVDWPTFIKWLGVLPDAPESWSAERMQEFVSSLPCAA